MHDPEQRTPPKFGDPAYWEERYRSSQEEIEWLHSYLDIAGLIEGAARADKNCKVLHVGCGNSKLPEQMYDDGYTNIVNIDIAPAIIDTMLSRNQSRPWMCWLCMDATNLSFLDSTFDLVLDKSTLDVFKCIPDEAESDASIQAYLSEVYRVLTEHGIFLCSTFSMPPAGFKPKAEKCGFSVGTQHIRTAGRLIFLHICHKKSAVQPPPKIQDDTEEPLVREPWIAAFQCLDKDGYGAEVWGPINSTVGAVLERATLALGQFTETQVQWCVKDGLPDVEGADLSVDKSGVSTVAGIQSRCESICDCVGFAYWPAENRWYPKRKHTGFDASTASYSQKHASEKWEWHYINSRAQADAEFLGVHVDWVHRKAVLRFGDTVPESLFVARPCGTGESCQAEEPPVTRISVSKSFNGVRNSVLEQRIRRVGSLIADLNEEFGAEEYQQRLDAAHHVEELDELIQKAQIRTMSRHGFPVNGATPQRRTELVLMMKAFNNSGMLCPNLSTLLSEAFARSGFHKKSQLPSKKERTRNRQRVQTAEDVFKDVKASLYPHQALINTR